MPTRAPPTRQSKLTEPRIARAKRAEEEGLHPARSELAELNRVPQVGDVKFKYDWPWYGAVGFDSG
jgi:hypothetical protein